MDTITILVHGTVFAFLKPLLFNLFYCPPGLLPASTFETTNYLTTLTTTLVKAGPDKFNSSMLYYFGWSGSLSAQERKKSAHELYKALLSLQEMHQARYNQKPKLRLITHSHGGNVALNLARVAHMYKDTEFTIDELIVLAVPVQQETAHLIRHSCFKKIYSFYSSADIVQVIDPQIVHNASNTIRNKGILQLLSSLHKEPILSRRLFKSHQNLVQIKTLINGKPLLHSDFLKLNFLSLLPQTLAWLENHPNKVLFPQQRRITVELTKTFSLPQISF